jgi:hypothetical protein
VNGCLGLPLISNQFIYLVVIVLVTSTTHSSCQCFV